MKKQSLNRLIFGLLLSLYHAVGFGEALAEPFAGKVVAVSDGDTITVMHLGVGEKVRLHGVDAPEKRSRFRSPRETVR